MPTNDNQLKRLQDAIVDRLKDDATIGGLPIHGETKGDLGSEIDIALDSMGIVLVVQTVKAGISNPNLSKPVFDSITFTVEVSENVMLNKRITALDAAVAVVESLHHYRAEGVPLFENKMINPAANTLTPYTFDGNNGYYVNFTIGNAG